MEVRLDRVPTVRNHPTGINLSCYLLFFISNPIHDRVVKGCGSSEGSDNLVLSGFLLFSALFQLVVPTDYFLLWFLVLRNKCLVIRDSWLPA